jgi:hypothetical protein
MSAPRKQMMKTINSMVAIKINGTFPFPPAQSRNIKTLIRINAIPDFGINRESIFKNPAPSLYSYFN